MNFTNPNRREFLQIGTGAAATLALSACAPSLLTEHDGAQKGLFPLPPPESVTTDFDMTASATSEVADAFTTVTNSNLLAL